MSAGGLSDADFPVKTTPQSLADALDEVFFALVEVERAPIRNQLGKIVAHKDIYRLKGFDQTCEDPPSREALLRSLLGAVLRARRAPSTAEKRHRVE